jgi:hypothetical protein
MSQAPFVAMVGGRNLMGRFFSCSILAKWRPYLSVREIDLAAPVPVSDAKEGVVRDTNNQRIEMLA